MNSIRLIVFDMAGTVVNEQNIVYRMLQESLAAGGYPFSLEEVLASAGGKEKRQAIEDLIALRHSADGIPTSAVYSEFLRRLKVAYEALDVTTYPGVEALLNRLRSRGIKIALNTGYNRPTATQLLEKMNWREGQAYHLLVTADDVAHSRPAPDMILLAMEQLGIPSAAAVAKVGDSDIDIREGQAADCGITVGVTTGAHSQEQLAAAHPTYIVDSLAELDKVIPEMRGVDAD
jgi:phosphonatase-like hydrolase